MYKKQAFAALILILAILAASCSPAAQTVVETPVPPQIEVTPPAELEADPPLCEVREEENEDIEEDRPGEIDEATREALNRMQPIYYSYARAMNDTGTTLADTSDDIFAWTVLNYLCANYAELHPSAEKTDTQNILTGAALSEFAQACFAGSKAIPELPRQTFNIMYNQESDQYFIGSIVNSDEYAKTVRYSMYEDGSIEAIIAWMGASKEGDERIIATYIFALAPNVDSSLIEQLFDYSVTGVREGFTDTVSVKSIYEKDGKQYATANFANSANVAPSNPGGLDFDLVSDLSVQAPAEFEFSDEDVELQIGLDAKFTFNGMGALFPDLSMAEAESDSRAFFIKNAARESNGEHLIFNVNVIDGIIYGGSLF